MATRCKDWMTELWNEAPWYFWGYIAMALAATAISKPLDRYIIIIFTVIFTYLIKTYDLLHKKYIYLIIWPALFFTEIIIKNKFGEYILFTDPRITNSEYFRNYGNFIAAFFTIFLSLPVVVWVEKSIKKSIQILLCLFCIIMACETCMFFSMWILASSFFHWH